jgi:EAL domain-containing protein (putative c-di-GMP-specific phosphodiesterase class I)
LSDFAAKDAGTALLAEIRPDFVRLSASPLRGIPGNSINLRAVQATIRVVRESGAKAIAAGISTAVERAAYLEAGCELGQGALFEERKRADDRAPSTDGRRRPIPNASSAIQDAFYLSLALDSPVPK